MSGGEYIVKKSRFATFFLTLLLTLTVFTGNVAADSTDGGAGRDTSAQPVQPEEGFVCDKLTDPNSKSIFMVSLDTGTVVFTMNPDERLPMASLTKIMTYIVTAETVSDLHNTRTTVPESVEQELAGTGSSLAFLQTGEEFSIYELLNLMMVPSGNDAALTLAKYVDALHLPAEDASFDTDGDGQMSFVELMNRKARELGCTNTHFMNPHGLYEEDHYTTAREMATIAQYALTLPYFAEITSQTYYTQAPTNLTSESRTVSTTNRMLVESSAEYYPYATGIKTGSLNESGYCIAASGLYDGYSYLVICLGSPYIDEYGNHIDYHGEMYVEESSIIKTVDLPEYVQAPVKKGDEIGTATYTYKGEVLARVPLVAAESAERSEIIQTIEQGKEIITSPWFIITASVILVLAVAYVILAVLMNRKRRRMRRVKKYRDM